MQGDGTRAAGARIESLPFSAGDYRAEIARMKRKRRIVAILCVILALLVGLIVAAVLVFKLPGSLHVVNTSNMEPALSEGQLVITQEIDEPNSGDVIIYRDDSGTEQFARVLALAGEWVSISSDRSVTVSEVSLEGSTSPEVVKAGQSIVSSRQVPSGSCFVISDAAVNSTAQLAGVYTPIPYSSIVGRAAYRVWPLIV